MSHFNLGDALVQLISLGFLVFLIVFIVSFFRSNKERRNQINRMEKKIDELQEQLKKD